VPGSIGNIIRGRAGERIAELEEKRQIRFRNVVSRWQGRHENYSRDAGLEISLKFIVQSEKSSKQNSSKFKGTPKEVQSTKRENLKAQRAKKKKKR